MDKLSRRLLPFYMKLPVFWAFIILSVLGQLLWVAAISQDVRIDLRWVKFRLRFRDRLRFHAGEMDISVMATVLSKSSKAADNLLGRERSKTLNFLHLPCTRITNFLSVLHPLP